MSWIETPRGLAVITGVLAVLFAGVGFWIGYDIGRNPSPQQIVVRIEGATIHIPAQEPGK